SAVSLPAGSLIGLYVKPGARLTSSLMAFGGGALLFALTIEIVAHSFEIAGFWSLALGLLVGGILYELLNQGLNNAGGFLRKGATLIRHLTQVKRKKAHQILDHLSQVKILQSMPPEDIARLVPRVEEIKVEEGDRIIREGESGDALYLIDSGRVEVIRNGKSVATLQAGDAVGEMSLLTGEDRVATVIAREKTTFYKINKSDFDELIEVSPEMKKAVEKLLLERSEDLARKSMLSRNKANRWKKKAASHLSEEDFSPTSLEMKEAMKKQENSSLGIWLGIFLDGIPESLVLGITISDKLLVPWALVAGVFLANLPEAMSSSTVMKEQDYSFARILLMWSSITVMTGFGAWAGHVFLQGMADQFFAVIEGVAAGAMLTMVSETMFPEAYERGGAVVGLSTLAGFICALFIKYIAVGAN
ncbi:MAG: cyclic nucleotide-binding domain-containing protein, partial [bacterium]